ncbi:S-layer homology domain-containing protein [Virgibacillus sp. FSP13]
MTRKHIFGFLILTFILMVTFTSGSTSAYAASKPVYTISPSDNTYHNNMMNYSTYTNKTKHYYLIRSYLEQLEKTGGGTLVLTKGTYTVTNALYVPSNVTIKLQDGVKIVKGTETGTSKMNAAKSLFQLIRPSQSQKKGVYGGYRGDKNIKIIGSGTATIDLNYVKKAIAVVAGHNQNITIQNIHFKNSNSSHFIEIDATKNAVIKNNKFTGSKPSKGLNAEAINIDTPDALTKGFNSIWSNMDKTPNDNMKIVNNTFYNLDRAIGTHQYSGGKYHNKIVIRNNKIEKTRSDAIRVMNWSNSVIEGNTFKDVAPGPNNDNRGILASGAINPTFQNNIFVSIPRAMQFTVWKNNGTGSQYDVTYNKLSAKNKNALKTNTIVDYQEDFIRINKEYLKYDKQHTDFIDIKTSRFSDLIEGDSGYEETIDLVDKGIINGYPNFTFKPYRSITRQHVALMLAKTLDLTPKQGVENVLKEYEDVDRNHPYAEQIAAVTEAKVFKGSDGRFNPDEKITRAQMATVLVKAFALQEKDIDVNLIDLHRIDMSHRNNVKILAQNGITIGKQNSNGERYYDGTEDLKRVQFAIFLRKTME